LALPEYAGLGIEVNEAEIAKHPFEQESSMLPTLSSPTARCDW
jgi:hypothetical protein